MPNLLPLRGNDETVSASVINNAFMNLITGAITWGGERFEQQRWACLHSKHAPLFVPELPGAPASFVLILKDPDH